MNAISKVLVTLLLVALGVAACNRHAAQPAQHAQRRPADAALAVKPSSAPVVSVEKAGGMTEESESVADIAAGLSPIAAAVAANTPAAAAPIPSHWVESRNYNTLTPAEPTTVDPSKVEVVEVFWYGCGHCNHLDPVLEEWRKHKPAYVEFRRVHVMWGNTHDLARLFFTIKKLGKLEQLHSAVFHEIHDNHNPLLDPEGDPAQTEKLQRAFLKAHGVTDAQFDDAYRSFDVANDLRKAEDYTRRVHAMSVPWIVVNGKYTTDVQMAGGESELTQLINDLAASERRH